MGDPVYPMIWAYLGCPTCWRPFPWGSPEGVSNLFQSPPDRDICEIFLWKTYTLPIKIQKHVTFPHDFTIFYLQKYLEIPTHIVHFAARARHGPRWPERRNTSSTPRWNWLHGITFFQVEVSAWHIMACCIFWKMSGENWMTIIAGQLIGLGQKPSYPSSTEKGNSLDFRICRVYWNQLLKSTFQRPFSRTGSTIYKTKLFGENAGALWCSSFS